MAAVLGISAYYHDAAAALVVDGSVVAAMQQERFSRIKNDPSLPFAAARACLAQAGVASGDLDAVVFHESPFGKIERVLVSLLQTYPWSWRSFARAIGSQVGSKLWVLDQLAEGLHVERSRVEFVEHHHSHAASAFFVSPFEEAAVLTVDGVGEDTSTALWYGRGRELKPIARIAFPHSLGLLYAALTAYLGFAVNEGEYKVMGLAAFGKPRFADEFAELLQCRDDGGFELGLRYFRSFADADLGFGPRLEVLLGPRRRPGLPWDLATERDQRYADVAASLQRATEAALIGLCRAARRETEARCLCLAGGVALNAVANARIHAEADFDRVFVQPAAGDAGGALGAAILGALERGDPRPPAMTTAALGVPVDAARAAELATSLGLDCRRVADPGQEAARLLLADKIVGFAMGRGEWGPRALGQRSILALPRRVATRDRLNRVIKRREPFRPFAPAVLEEHVSDWFAAAPNDMTPFMTTVAPIREECADALGAVRHVDGTGRIQSVTVNSAPELHAVLRAVHDATGVPVLLNTSFNGRGEPIVNTELDAIVTHATHRLDALVVGDLVLERPRAGGTTA